jgi:hypothetical protein
MHHNCLLRPEIIKEQLNSVFSTIFTKKSYDDCSIAIISRFSEVLRRYEYLNLREKCYFLRINNKSKNIKKRITWYDSVFSALSSPKTLKQISYYMKFKTMITKTMITKKRLNRLVNIGLILKKVTFFINNNNFFLLSNILSSKNFFVSLIRR